MMDLDDNVQQTLCTERRNLRSNNNKAVEKDRDRIITAATRRPGRKRKSQLQSVNKASLSPPIFPTLNGQTPPANDSDRTGLALLERDPLLSRACGGFRLFVRRFTDQQLLKCIRSPSMNTLKQFAPVNLRYLHILRNAWNKQTLFERLDWEEQFSRDVKNGEISTIMPDYSPSLVLLEGPGIDHDQERLRQCQWLGTIDSEHLPCPLCSVENQQRYKINDLLHHLSLSHFAVHLYACHCCSKAFSRAEALKVHSIGGACPGFAHFMRENIKRKDNFVFDFSYVSLICAECGLHLILSPRCDQEKLADIIRNIIFCHSSQCLVLCMTFTAMELVQPTIRIQFPRPILLGQAPMDCPNCAKMGLETVVDLEKHCATEHKGTMVETKNCPKCPASFYTEPLLRDHILSHHAQRDIPMVTQLLCTLPQLPPALDKSETVLLIGGCGVTRVSGGSKAVDLLKWTPTEKRTALDGQIRRGRRRRKQRRLFTPGSKDDKEDMEDEEEEESAEDQNENSSQASSSTPSMTFGQWKEKMRRLEAKIFSAGDPLSQFLSQLDLPVVFSGRTIVQNPLNGALLNESVFQCNKCNTIILGETSAREHVSGCLQDEVDQQDWTSNFHILFNGTDFPFCRIRCKICSTDCCSITSLRRHYIQDHAILCGFQPNQSTIQQCADVLISREWANTEFDRELMRQINSSKMPRITSEMESECDANQQQFFNNGELTLASLHSSLLHMLEDQQNGTGDQNISCKSEPNESGESLISSTPKKATCSFSASFPLVKQEVFEEEDEEEQHVFTQEYRSVDPDPTHPSMPMFISPADSGIATSSNNDEQQSQEQPEQQQQNSQNDGKEVVVKRKRGRPRKTQEGTGNGKKSILEQKAMELRRGRKPKKAADADWCPRTRQQRKSYQLRRKTKFTDEKDEESEPEPVEQEEMITEKVKIEPEEEETTKEDQQPENQATNLDQQSTSLEANKLQKRNSKRDSCIHDNANSSLDDPTDVLPSYSSAGHFTCFMCNFTEKSKDEFGQHLRVHPEQWEHCPICEHKSRKNGGQKRGEDPEKKTFDNPIQFFKHTQEYHMDIQANQVLCPFCGHCVLKLSGHQQTVAVMFRHLVYECTRTDVCVLCGQHQFDSESIPDTEEEADESTGTIDRLALHRELQHRLIFDRFICTSCKCGFHSRDLFMRHQCSHALRCICSPSYRFRTRSDYSMHFQKFIKQWKVHGLMQSESEMDTANREFVLNDDYLQWVEQLQRRRQEEMLEKETAKAVAEIKKKVADLNGRRELNYQRVGSLTREKEETNHCGSDEEKDLETKELRPRTRLLKRRRSWTTSSNKEPKLKRFQTRPMAKIASIPDGLRLSSQDLMKRAKSSEDASILRILCQASKWAEAERKEMDDEKSESKDKPMEKDEDDGKDDDQVVEEVVESMIARTVREVENQDKKAQPGKQSAKRVREIIIDAESEDDDAVYIQQVSTKAHLANKKMFNCAKCQMIFHSVDALDQHKAMAHVEYFSLPLDTVTLLCRRCCIAFQDPLRYSQHMKGHSPNPIACRRCSYVAASNVDFVRHNTEHNTDYVCSICLVRYTNDLNLAHHIAKVHGKELAYFCKSCGHCSTSLRSVLGHIFVEGQCLKNLSAGYLGVCDAAQLRFLPANSNWVSEGIKMVTPVECRHVCLLASADPLITCNVCLCPIPLNTWMKNFFPPEAPKFQCKDQCTLADDDNGPDCRASTLLQLLQLQSNKSENKSTDDEQQRSLQIIQRRLERLLLHEHQQKRGTISAGSSDQSKFQTIELDNDTEGQQIKDGRNNNTVGVVSDPSSLLPFRISTAAASSSSSSSRGSVYFAPVHYYPKAQQKPPQRRGYVLPLAERHPMPLPRRWPPPLNQKAPTQSVHVSPPYHVTGPSSGSPLLIRVEPSVKPKSKGTPETEAKRPADDDKMKREEASCDEVSSSNDVISVETQPEKERKTITPPPQLVRMAPRPMPLMPPPFALARSSAVRVPPHRLTPTTSGEGVIPMNRHQQFRGVMRRSSARAPLRLHAPYCRYPHGYCKQKIGTHCVLVTPAPGQKIFFPSPQSSSSSISSSSRYVDNITSPSRLPSTPIPLNSIYTCDPKAKTSRLMPDSANQHN